MELQVRLRVGKRAAFVCSVLGWKVPQDTQERHAIHKHLLGIYYCQACMGKGCHVPEGREESRLSPKCLGEEGSMPR